MDWPNSVEVDLCFKVFSHYYMYMGCMFALSYMLFLIGFRVLATYTDV